MSPYPPVEEPPATARPAAAALQQIASEAALAAGVLLRASLPGHQQIERAFPHDLKLWMDRACEREALRLIREKFPHHAVLSEEAGFDPGREAFLWIVDALDGTVNYHHGIPFYCSSVACYAVADGSGEAGGPAGAGNAAGHLLPDGRRLGAGLAGAVFDPLRQELFAAAAGRGALLNQAPLVTPETRRLDEAIVSLSFGAREESISYICRALPGFIRASRKVRSIGSTALDIVQVAAGRTGAFVQMGTNLWDFAAASVIATAAGAVVDAREYSPGRFRVIASAAGLYEQVRREAEGPGDPSDASAGVP